MPYPVVALFGEASWCIFWFWSLWFLSFPQFLTLVPTFPLPSSLRGMPPTLTPHPVPWLHPRVHSFLKTAISASVLFSVPSFQFFRSQCSGSPWDISILNTSSVQVQLSPSGSDFVSFRVLLLLGSTCSLLALAWARPWSGSTALEAYSVYM